MKRSEADPIEILLIEDNPSDVYLTREALGDWVRPNNLSVASDGEEALAFLQRRAGFEEAPRPDIIFLDLNLPNINGHELLGLMKSDPDSCSIPVVILSTSEAESDIELAYRLQANCYISKPVDLDEFSQVLRMIEQFWFDTVKLPHRRRRSSEKLT